VTANERNPKTNQAEPLKKDKTERARRESVQPRRKRTKGNGGGKSESKGTAERQLDGKDAGVRGKQEVMPGQSDRDFAQQSPKSRGTTNRGFGKKGRFGLHLRNCRQWGLGKMGSTETE